VRRHRNNARVVTEIGGEGRRRAGHGSRGRQPEVASPTRPRIWAVALRDVALVVLMVVPGTVVGRRRRNSSSEYELLRVSTGRRGWGSPMRHRRYGLSPSDCHLLLFVVHRAGIELDCLVGTAVAPAMSAAATYALAPPSAWLGRDETLATVDGVLDGWD
jgi:hypothetical protein